MSRPSRTTPHRRRKFVAVAFVVGVIGWALTPKPASATVAAPVDAGDVVVVDGNDGSRQLTHGGSATDFSLRLPDGAACPGDSLHDQWRVQSFIIPATDDPGTLQYGVIAPDGTGRFVLYTSSGEPFIHVLTRSNSGAGKPGGISGMPALSFIAFKPGILSSGRYRIGIACSLFRKTAEFWDTEIVITTSPGDSPGQFVWRLANATVGADEGSDEIGWLVPALGGLCAAALGWFVRQRRTRNVPPRPTPSPPTTRRPPVLTKEPK